MGARTPCVGVGGTIISGGFSWLSAEHGCISDPANMMDARVVKHDGSIVWASSEPELLWALRGGGGGFGGKGPYDTGTMFRNCQVVLNQA